MNTSHTISYQNFPEQVRSFIESYFSASLTKFTSLKDNLNAVEIVKEARPASYSEIIKAEFCPPYKIAYYDKHINWAGIVHETVHVIQYHLNGADPSIPLPPSYQKFASIEEYMQDAAERFAFMVQEEFSKFAWTEDETKSFKWKCFTCGNEVYSMSHEKPQSIKWNDGHTCHYRPIPEDYKETPEEKIKFDNFNFKTSTILNIDKLGWADVEKTDARGLQYAPKYSVWKSTPKEGANSFQYYFIVLDTTFRFIERDYFSNTDTSKKNIVLFKGIGRSSLDDLIRSASPDIKNISGITLSADVDNEEFTFIAENYRDLQRDLFERTSWQDVKDYNGWFVKAVSKEDTFVGVVLPTNRKGRFSHFINGFFFKLENDTTKEIDSHLRTIIENKDEYLQYPLSERIHYNVSAIGLDPNKYKIIPLVKLDELNTTKKLSWQVVDDLTGWLLHGKEANVVSAGWLFYVVEDFRDGNLKVIGVLIDDYLEEFPEGDEPISEEAEKNATEYAMSELLENLNSYDHITISPEDFKTLIPIKKVITAAQDSSQDFSGYKDLNKNMYTERAKHYDINDGAALYWSSDHAQKARFNALIDIGDLSGAEILDIGCGNADFFDFIKDKGIELKKYVGIDLVEEIVNKAQELHPGTNISLHDIQQNPLETDSFDYVFGSGIFALDNGNWKEYTVDMLRKMLDCAKKGVAVNFLRQTQHMFWQEISKLENLTGWMIKLITSRDLDYYGVVVKSDKLRNVPYAAGANDDVVWAPFSLSEEGAFTLYEKYLESAESEKYLSYAHIPTDGKIMPLYKAEEKYNKKTSAMNLRYTTPQEVLQLVKQYVSDKVLLKENYLNDDFTIFIYKG